MLAGLAAPGVPTAGARPRSADRAAIQELLDRRARAWLDRDEDAFMATVSRAVPDFHARQLRLFRRAAGVPFRSYRLVARWELFGDLARPSDEARYGAEVAIPLTHERYTLGSYDRTPAVEDLWLTFVKEDEGWRVAGDSDLAPLGLASARHLWDYGPIVQQRSEHFSLLHHPCGQPPGCPVLPDRLLPLAEAALDRVRGLWSAPWRPRVVVLAPTTTDELEDIIQATFELDDFVAFASSTVDLARGFDYGGHRVLLNPEAVAGRNDESVLTIMAHELLHVASRSVSGPFVPTVVEEGIADYVGHGGDPDALAFLRGLVAADGFDRRLPEDWEFLTGSGTDIFTSYQEAHSAMRFFVEHWGLDRLVAFYRRLGARKIAPGTTRYHVDVALRRTIGVGAQTFERLWADSIDPR